MRSIIILIFVCLFATSAFAADRIAYSWDAFGCFNASLRASGTSSTVRACRDNTRYENHAGRTFSQIKAFRNTVSLIYLVQTHRYLQWKLPLDHWRTTD